MRFEYVHFYILKMLISSLIIKQVRIVHSAGVPISQFLNVFEYNTIFQAQKFGKKMIKFINVNLIIYLYCGIYFSC